MSVLRERIITAAMVLVAMAGRPPASAAQAPRFYPDDPLMVEPVTQDVAHARPYEPDIAYNYFHDYVGGRGDRMMGRASNVNTIDEVPDGPFFVNRAGRMPLTPELVARAANQDDGPAPGAWTVTSSKTSGVNPGFTMRDARGTRWFFKFDPPGWPTMATGSEIVGAKLFWALGYYTAEYHIVRVVRSNLVIAPTARVTGEDGRARPMRPSDLDPVFARTGPQADGSYRAIASKAIPGTYVGRIRYEGTRRDDPNDLIPHEDRREIRALSVFCAWLNRVDVKRDQSMVTVADEGGHRFMRRYLLDWSSILGSAGTEPRREWEGYERQVEQPLSIAKRAVTLGAIVPQWRREAFYEDPAVGRLPADESQWDPERWQPLVTNAAFRHARADDKFWAAYKMTFVTEPMVRAVVAEAQFGDSVAAEHVIADIMARRARILETYLPAINPIVDPTLDADGHLSFRNAAVEFAGSPPPRGYQARWLAFDNETGTATPLGVTEGEGTRLDAPVLPDTGFIQVELSCIGAPRASWEQRLTLHFRREGGQWVLVGLRRLP